MNPFMSPIAIKSARAANKRLEAGGTIKGTGTRRTEYKRPPIAALIGACGSVQALGRMRGMLSKMAHEGRMTPSEKTEAEWERIFWKRVLVIMLSTQEPCFVYNYILRWPKPPHFAAAIEAAFEAQCRSLPSPTDRLRAQGITIEGIA